MSRSSIDATTISVMSRPRTKICATKSPITIAAARIPPEHAPGISEAEASRPVDADPRPCASAALSKRMPVTAAAAPANAAATSTLAATDPVAATSDAGEERTDECSDPLADARRDVRGDELAGVRAKAGQQRGLDRPDERAGAGHHRGEDVRELDREPGRDDDRRRDSRRPQRTDVDRREHAVAAIALDERGRERRRDDPGNDAHRSEDPGGERPARVVDDHEQHHEEAPSRRPSRPSRQSRSGESSGSRARRARPLQPTLPVRSSTPIISPGATARFDARVRGYLR